VINIFIGTKAQMIKMGPVLKEMERQNISYNFIFSGQHRQTIKDIRENFKIKKPDIVLYEGPEIISSMQLFIWSIRIIFNTLRHRKEIFKEDGIVLNHGDAFSALLGSIVARLSGQKNAHVESGLRSFDYLNPFPEELTRVLVFRLTDLYFCPGKEPVSNLAGYGGEKVDTKHNTLYDALSQARTQNNPEKGKYGIVSIHRYENIFNRNQLRRIIDDLNMVADNLRLLFIMHPPTKKKLADFRLTQNLSNKIELRNRLDYFDFITLLKGSEFLITDGGSNQEECYYLGKPCLLMRKATERSEGLGSNVVLSRYDSKTIVNFTENYKKYARKGLQSKVSPSRIIVDKMRKYR